MGNIAFTKMTPAQHGGRGSDFVIDNKRVVKGQVVFSASYASNGDTLDLAGVGLKEVNRVLIDCGDTILDNVGGLSVTLGGTASAPKLIAWDANATEVSNATNLSGRSAIRVWLLGS